MTDALLLAMHDLRSVLVRRKAERLLAEDGRSDAGKSGASPHAPGFSPR